ncbi:MAG: NAD(P)/FAD-dependent oxidoreductase [Fuerstiella sp.]
MKQQIDAIILGAGPAGSTAATLLTEAGLNVVVLEKDHFPRFHIGESLLPATVRIFERLGVHDQIRDRFIRKPGGKWLYGEQEVPGDFAVSDSKATFKDTPYSYLVERADFDHILIQRSQEAGADVRFGCEMKDLLKDGDRIVGVRYQDEAGQSTELYARQVIDATGLRAAIPSKLRIRNLTEPHRIGIYAQYSATPAREDIKAGWFLGQMFFDGWTWLLALPNDRFSVGTVMTVDRFKKSNSSPTELLERLIEENSLLSKGMAAGAQRISDVMVTGNMGNSSERLAGEGWVAVGDAAYFIDPCYSSGVHLAMKSAELVADRIIELPKQADIPASAFDAYQQQMRQHEKSVHNMVAAFYMASRNTTLQKIITKLQGGFFSRKFVTFVGGDFDKNSGFISRLRYYSKFISAFFRNDKQQTPGNHPSYLHSPVANPTANLMQQPAEMPRRKAG